MKKYSRLVTVFWISLLVLTMFPFAINPAKSEVSLQFSVTQGANTWIVEPIQGSVPAEEFYNYSLSTPVYIAPFAFLWIAPNPVGINQELYAVAFLDPLPPDGEFFHNLTLEVTKPDGSSETLGPYNTGDDPSAFNFTYIPTQPGTYDFQLFYPGEGFYDNFIIYQASQSLISQITVQEDPVPVPSPPEAPSGRQPPKQFGSGHTPYIVPDGSAIYLYQDPEGELSLITHHGEEAPSCPITEINYELSGIPNGTYIALSDDSFEEEPNELRFHPYDDNIILGDWYKDWGESDGGIISGLTGEWEITLDVSLYQAHLPYVLHWFNGIEEATIEFDIDPEGEEPIVIKAEILAQGSLKVNNVLDPDSPVPEDDWKYILINDNGTLMENFTLPAAGNGSISFSSLPAGTYLLAQTMKFNYDTSITLNETAVEGETIDNKILLTLEILPGETALVVEFNNAFVPDLAWAKKAQPGDSSPPAQNTYEVPCRRAIPVQVVWDPDIELEPDGQIDLIKDKATRILVNLADVLPETGPVQPTDYVTTSLTSTPSDLFQPLQSTTTGQNIEVNSITIFTIDPPSILGDYTINCTITYGPDPDPQTQAPLSEEMTYVSVKETSELALYYSYLSRSDSYGTAPADYATMLSNSRDFINDVYPVPQLTVDSNELGLAGNATEPNYKGILKDCQYIAQQAKLRFPNSPNAIGIAIGPDLQLGGSYTNYFAYHGAAKGKKTAVGVSFGPGVKGVVALEGYYSVVAHEIGHTFGLYWGEPEQYETCNPGEPANGFRPKENEWRSGYDFMGLSPYQSTTNVWVNTDTTFEPLFRSLKTTPEDPPILLVNFIIYEDDTVELPYTWYSMPYGTPDAVPTGDYAIRCVAADGTVLSTTSFDATFFMNLDLGIEVGEDLPEDFSGFGTIEINFAGSAFAIEYPVGTATIELLDTTNPPGEEVIKTISADSVASAGFGGFLPPIKADGTSVFKRGRTVPVKFQLIGSEGNFISTATAKIYTVKVSDTVIGTEEEATSTSKATTGNLFRYDPINNQYIFNLSTKPMSKGTWQILVVFDDGGSRTVQISLR